MVTRKQQSETGSSQQVLATNVDSLMEQQNHSQLVLSTNNNTGFLSNVIEAVTGRSLGTQLTTSLMPRGVPLNAPLTKVIVDGLQQSAQTALQTQSENRVRADIPTAEVIRRNGFKTGSKLLIKIDPSRKATDIEIPQLVLDTFSLQGVAEPDEERYQLHETFESEVLFLFGRRPRIWTLQGIVMNGRRSPDIDPNALAALSIQESIAAVRENQAKDMDFANKLLQDWEDYYRGSRAVESRSRTYISYEDSIIEGTLLGLTVVRNAQIPSAINATLTFVVHQRAFLGQEVRNGLTPANLADLIAKTNASGASADKVPPSELKVASPTVEEVNRRERQAQDQVDAAATELARLQTERANLNQAVADETLAIELAQQQAVDAAADLLTAENDLAAATTQAEIDDANERIADASLRAQDAGRDEAAARSRLQAARSRLNTVNAEVDNAAENEENARAKQGALAATATQAL